MTLSDFKEYIESFPDGHAFEFGVSCPFSWRGSYDEVAFRVSKMPTTKEHTLENIEFALSGTFFGYKGGEFQYFPFTEIHFEENNGRYTDGGYCLGLLSRIESETQYKDNEERLVKKAFK